MMLIEGRWRQPAEPVSYVPGAAALPWDGGVGAARLAESAAALGLPARVVDLSTGGAPWTTSGTR
ncbi:hypothetical protein ACPC54_09595 [Kitasatospora sp. NPDC094028]